jgi:hypothetical protein
VLSVCASSAMLVYAVSCEARSAVKS